jgi:hypothetical protein
MILETCVHNFIAQPGEVSGSSLMPETPASNAGKIGRHDTLE